MEVMIMESEIREVQPADRHQQLAGAKNGFSCRTSVGSVALLTP